MKRNRSEIRTPGPPSGTPQWRSLEGRSQNLQLSLCTPAIEGFFCAHNIIKVCAKVRVQITIFKFHTEVLFSRTTFASIYRSQPTLSSFLPSPHFFSLSPLHHMVIFHPIKSISTSLIDPVFRPLLTYQNQNASQNIFIPCCTSFNRQHY